MSFSLIPSLSLLPTAPPKRPPAKITIEFTITPIGTKNTLLHISIINLKMITSQIYPIIEAYSLTTINWNSIKSRIITDNYN